MNKVFVTKTKNGYSVYVDVAESHAATHLKDHPELFDFMKEVLSEYVATEDLVRFETDLGRAVGHMDMVETSNGDDVFYAKRPNREKFTRFVRGKKPQPTNFVTIELRKKDGRELEVFTAFIGRLTPSFPLGKDDPNEQNKEFWNCHALVAENQKFIEETVTVECPW